MTQLEFITILQQTMVLVLTMATPILLVGMIVGLAVSVFQSITQIQEASLTFVPKLIAGIVTLIILAPWFLQVYTNAVQNIFQRMATI